MTGIGPVAVRCLALRDRRRRRFGAHPLFVSDFVALCAPVEEPGGADPDPLPGELLMLGFEVAQSTVSKYMVQGRSQSQGWKTFFRNHAQAIAAIDLFVVPTLTL